MPNSHVKPTNDKPPRRIAPEEVWLVATQLKKENIRPTPNAVRKALGDRGSFTTIQEHLAAWNERQARSDAIFENLPAASTEALADMLWELIAHGADVADSVARHQLTSLQEAFDHQSQQLEGACRSLDIEREQFAEAREKLLAEKTESQAILDDLKSKHESTITELEESSRAIQTAQSQLAALEAENRRLTQTVVTNDAEITALSSRHEELLTAHGLTKSQAADLERLCNHQKSSIAHMEEQLAASSVRMEKMQSQLNSLQQAEKAAAQALSAADARTARVEGQLSAALAQLEKTEAELERARREADERVMEVVLGASKQQREMLRQIMGKPPESSDPGSTEESPKVDDDSRISR